MPVENTNPAVDANDAAPQETQFDQDLFSKELAKSQQSGDSAQSNAAGTAAQAVASPDWQAAAKEAGFTVDQFKSQGEFLKALAEERKQQSQLATLGQQVAPHYQQFSTWIQEQQSAAAKATSQQPQQQQPAKQGDDPNAWMKDHFSQAWKVPSFEPAWQTAIKQGALVMGEDGRYAAAPGAELMVANMIGPANAFREAQAERMQEMFLRGNPFEQIHSALSPVWQKQMQEMIRQELGQHTQETTTQTALQQWEQANASALYTQDTLGNQVETPAGKALFDEAHRLMDKGFKDPLGALELAAKLTGFQGPVQKAAPEQQAAEKKTAFLENARQRAAHAPNSGAYSPTNTPDAPFSVDESELENLFTNALATAGK